MPHPWKRFAHTITVLMAVAGVSPSVAQRELAPPLGSEYTQLYNIKGPHFSVHAMLADETNPAGPYLDVVVANTARGEAGIDAILYPSHVAIRVHGPHGNVVPTLLGRQYFGPFLEGEDPGWSGSHFEPEITPGHTFTRHYRLSDYFLLNEPGDYTIFFMAPDEQIKSPKGIWVRSEDVHYVVK